MTTLSNARLVLPDRIIQGSIELEGERIRQIDEGPHTGRSGTDCEGDILMPGLIEMHTDNLEKHIVPRPGIYWPSPLASIIAHDNQVFNVGITTVLDSIAVGFSDEAAVRNRILDQSIQAIRTATAENLLKADHLLHLRCELPSASVYESFCDYAEDPLLKLVSVMDHTPGQRQWRDLDKWRTFHKEEKWNDDEAQAIVDHFSSLQAEYSNDNRHKIVRDCSKKGIPTASHDDTTVEHCIAASREGIVIAEFPTTLEAAAKARELGMATIMGAPNMVRGESHSGNISAESLASQDLLSGFSSDFMPISLLHAAFELNRRLDTPLHEALAKVTGNIAKMVNLTDRGELRVGKKADLIRVRKVEDLPVVIAVWKNGREIATSRI